MEVSVGRRAILTGGAACALGLLGGCGGGEAPRTPASNIAPSNTASSNTASSNTASSNTAPPGSAAPDVLAQVADVPVGGGKVVGGGVLLVQPGAGTIKAWDARCPHQGAILNPPDASGVINCPLHFSRFRSADGGLIDGLATTGLRPIPVNVIDGKITRG